MLMTNTEDPPWKEAVLDLLNLTVFNGINAK